MLKIMLVGCGGFIGSVLRYMVTLAAGRFVRDSSFPYATIAANLLGCFLIGLVGGLSENRNLLTAQTRFFLTVGLLGGFTTFSTFSYETYALWRDLSTVAAVGNVALQVGLGMVAVIFGHALARI